MLRISKLADYAVIITSLMAHKPKRAVSATEVAMRAKLAVPTVRKVMKQLLYQGLLTSSRGAAGGYQLACSPEKITLADVVEAMDGPISLVDCANPLKGCSRQRSCNVQENWLLINQLVKQSLHSVHLLEATQKMAIS